MAAAHGIRHFTEHYIIGYLPTPLAIACQISFSPVTIFYFIDNNLCSFVVYRLALAGGAPTPMVLCVCVCVCVCIQHVDVGESNLFC